MKPSKLLVVLPLALLASSLLCAPAFGFDLQTAGQVTVHANRLVTATTAWKDIPGMKGAVTLPKGGDLSLSLTVEGLVTGGSSPICYVRAIVDNVILTPTAPKLLANATGLRTTTINFFKQGLAAGPHRVRFQWSVNGGTTAQLWGRTMVMRFATATSPDLRLAGAEGSSLSRSAGGWTYLPGMTAQIDCPWDARIVTNVSGEFLSLVADRRVFIRAVIDGKIVASPADLVVAKSGSEGTRAFTFTAPKLTRGKHTVSIQWSSDAAAMVLFPTLTVTALPNHVNRLTGWLHQTAPSGPTRTTTSTAYIDVPDIGGSIFVPARCDLSVRFAAEASATNKSRFLLRALVDGKAANDQAYSLCTAGTNGIADAREGVFVVRNVERGWHSVKLQWCVDPTTPGGTARMGDRTLVASAIVGQRPLLVTAMESTRPQGYKYGGQFANSVVQGSPRVFRSYVADNFFRARPGVADWFSENSGGRLYVVEAAVIGPNLKKFNEKYYREQVPNPFTAMKVEALQAADTTFQFSYYDRDGDGFVKPDELYCLIVFYQDSTFGEVRSLPQVPTNDGVTIDYSGGVATVYTPDFKTTDELGLLDHELSHLLLGAGDMYESNDPTAPGPFSIMHDHTVNAHLDPLHKLKQGKWFEPIPITKDGYVTLRAIGQDGPIFKLHDPKSHAGEYFLVENRQRLGYDKFLPTDGLAVWHCDEKRLPNWRTAVEIEPAGGPNYNYGTYLFTGKNPGFHPDNDLWDYSSKTNTRWHDNTASKMGVWAVQIVGDGPDVKAFLDVPGPGILAQVESRHMLVDPFGRARIRIRLVNTHTATDNFKVSVNVTGEASWRVQYVTLNGYQQKILDVIVKPTPANFLAKVQVTAESTSASSITCTDEVAIHYMLEASGSSCPGCTVTLDCHHPDEASKFYEMRASFGSEPGFEIPGVGAMPLHADTLFFSTPKLPSIFRGFQGRLDAGGNARAAVAIPNLAALKGVSIFCAYVTYDTKLRAISNAVKITIQ